MNQILRKRRVIKFKFNKIYKKNKNNKTIKKKVKNNRKNHKQV